jgi:hypothetical protein
LDFVFFSMAMPPNREVDIGPSWVSKLTLGPAARGGYPARP